MHWIELLASVVVFLAGFVHWALRERKARHILSELDEGKRCVRCDGKETSIVDGAVHCAACGYTIALATLRASQLTERELAEATQPGPMDFH